MNILAIEDDNNICDLIRRTLDYAEIHVRDYRCINTMEAALDELKSFIPDVILLDLGLPYDSMDCDTPCEETISNIPFLSKIAPVIVVTGREGYFTHTIKAGAMNCLNKQAFLKAGNEAYLANAIAAAKAVWIRDNK